MKTVQFVLRPQNAKENINHFTDFFISGKDVQNRLWNGKIMNQSL